MEVRDRGIRVVKGGGIGVRVHYGLAAPGLRDGRKD